MQNRQQCARKLLQFLDQGGGSFRIPSLHRGLSSIVALMRYSFLVDTYETERLKVLSVWSMFRDQDLNTRPHPADRRGRSVREQMIHQCQSEDLWFRKFFAIDVATEVLPRVETRLEFIRKYADDSQQRALLLATRGPDWWEQE